jgi:hypothetical protein
MLPPEGELFSVDGVESLDGGAVQRAFVRVQRTEFFKQIKRINQDRGVRFPLGEGPDSARPLPTFPPAVLQTLGESLSSDSTDRFGKSISHKGPKQTMLHPGIFKMEAMAAGNFRSSRSKDGLVVRDKKFRKEFALVILRAKASLKYRLSLWLEAYV